MNDFDILIFQEFGPTKVGFEQILKKNIFDEIGYKKIKEELEFSLKKGNLQFFLI